MSKRLPVFVCASLAVSIACAPLSAREAPRSHCVVSDAIATAVFGTPMRGRAVGTSCAFVSSHGDSLVFLNVRNTFGTDRIADQQRAANDYFDAYGPPQFATHSIAGIGERAKFGTPIARHGERDALAYLITVQDGTVVTVYAPPSQRLRTEALALHVFHALP